MVRVSRIGAMAGAARLALRRLELVTRREHPDTAAALAGRWAELPERVRVPGQLLGTRTAGCEGTHGVFPRCNLACTPCYHSVEANRVRTDGEHTVAEIDRQMVYLRSRRGTGQHAQLIGGEVTLLGPAAHADALAVMQRRGRKPMSMTHGDFDYDYLRELAIDEHGRLRFRKLRFAGHFDSLMLGRRGAPRPQGEAELNAARRRFVGHFERLRREHGVRFDLAHNMTVTPRNIDQIADVVSDCLELGFGMLSFQPAARVGNPRRWRDGSQRIDADRVWRELERGVGARIASGPFQMGDSRCNRSAYGVLVGRRWLPFVDDHDSRDVDAGLEFVERFGGLDFEAPRALVCARVLRVLAAHPRSVVTATRWAARFVRRAGALSLLRRPVRPLTFVVHSFIDAADVIPAWEATKRGEVATDPRIRAAQERLAACSYSMAHPDSDELVPACVQHAVLDPGENARLAELLPLKREPSGAAARVPQ